MLSGNRLKYFRVGQRDGSRVKGNVSSSRGTEFNSQHLHGSFQLSVSNPSSRESDTLTQTYMQAKHQMFIKKYLKVKYRFNYLTMVHIYMNTFSYLFVFSLKFEQAVFF